MRASLRALSLLWILAASLQLQAHQSSIAYLFLEDGGTALKGRWEISLKDLEFVVGVDTNHDGEITWGEVKSRLAVIQDYAFQHLEIRGASGPITPRVADAQINKRPAGATLALLWEAATPPKSPVALNYSFGFDYDERHQCITTLQDRTIVLTKDRRTLELREETSSQGFPEFVRVGVFHIFEGIDHICFLLALMLPAVWRRTAQGWEAVTSFRAAFFSIAKIVTAFTLAHSITLALAALRLVTLPSALVESVIAFSVVVAALNNLWPLWTEKSWMVAFGFGLVHGFGFASALADIPAGAGSLLLSLGGFNLGVEAGQLCIVLVFLPLAFLLRDSWFYRWCAVRAGSIGIATVATLWLLERAFQITIF